MAFIPRRSHISTWGSPSISAWLIRDMRALTVHFGAVDVALAADADEMEVVELAELMAETADGLHDLAARAVDNVELAVRIVDHEQIGLLRVRPFHDRADRARVAVFQHE